MSFLHPSYLWALLGLAVPLAIHLWSKKQGKTIKVGSIKFLYTSDSQKSKRLQISEFWLLLLRMLILTFVVVILAEPLWKTKVENSPITYMFEASLLSTPRVKHLADSLHYSFDVRLLKAGFPTYQTELSTIDTTEVPHYWQLAKAMESLATDSIVVFTQGFMKGIQGKRPEINKPINWVTLNPGKAETHDIAGLKNRDAITVISVESQADYFKYHQETRALNDNIGDIPVFEKDTVQIFMVTDQEFQSEQRYIQASFQAIETYLNHPFEIKNITNPEELTFKPKDILIWLSEEQSPQVEGKSIIFQNNALADALIEEGDTPKEFYLTQRLNSENSIDKYLAAELLEVLDLYPKVETLAQAHDLRVMDSTLLKPNFNALNLPDSTDYKSNFSLYLWLALVVFLLLERFLSRYRKQ